LFKSKRARLVGIGCAAVAVTGTVGGYAVAAGGPTPANKVMAAGGKEQVVAPGSQVTILSGTMKTSKPTDLMLQVALECSILTDITTNSESTTARAEGVVRAWVEVDDRIVSLNQVSSPPQDPNDPATHNGNDSDKVTFCDREHRRSVGDDEILPDGVDEFTDFQRTKGSHAFNWVQMNVGSGVHKIEVVADLVTNAEGTATAEAIIGNRSLIVEPTKMANDAVIGPVGSS
jgi:hypothetical protein